MTDILPVYDHSEGNAYGQLLSEVFSKHKHFGHKNWRASLDDIDIYSLPTGPTIVSYHTGDTTPYEFKTVIARTNEAISLNYNHGSLYVQVAADTALAIPDLMAEAKSLWPARKPKTSMMVPINFWSYGGNGPEHITRDVDGLKWDDIEANYSASVRDEVGFVVRDFQPTSSGQLILWTGLPGTGKTTALRSLAYEWKKWATMHYITDVEKFFGSHADYMIQVLLEGEKDMWKLLILEDAGEFLQPSARSETGSPALSRFLNTVDGLIGHGLKTMIIVTTNEPLKTLHKAVSRPGRCAFDIDFKPFNSEEALEWLKNQGLGESELPGEVQLADLYAKINGVTSGVKDRGFKVGF
jgi:hypothetical protein